MSTNFNSRLWGNSQNGSSVTEINLRTEFHNLLYGAGGKPQKGHWIVYRRFDLTQTTEDYDEVYRTGDGGPGHPFTDTVVMTRCDPLITPNDESETPIGVLEGGVFTYYFEYNFRPNIDDQIFEISWINHRIRPVLSLIQTPYQDKYNIKSVFSYRCDSGRIEYWQVCVNKDRVSY